MVIVSPLPNGLFIAYKWGFLPKFFHLGWLRRLEKQSCEIGSWKASTLGFTVWVQSCCFGGVGCFLIGGLPLPTCFTSWGCLFLNVLCVFFSGKKRDLWWFHRGFCCDFWTTKVVKFDITPSGKTKKEVMRRISGRGNLSLGILHDLQMEWKMWIVLKIWGGAEFIPQKELRGVHQPQGWRWNIKEMPPLNLQVFLETTPWN